jgi:hypothetical protein
MGSGIAAHLASAGIRSLMLDIVPKDAGTDRNKLSRGGKAHFNQWGVKYDEPVPIYCDEGKSFNPEGICESLRRMMFVLSFHPRNGALRTMREKLMGFS